MWHAAWKRALAGSIAALFIACTGTVHAQISIPLPFEIVTIQKDGKAAKTDQQPSAKRDAPETEPPIVFDGPRSVDTDTGLNIGLGFYLISPYWESNRTFRTTTGAGGAGTIQTIREEDFDFDCTVSPRIFAGFVADNGLGFRVSWWHFDQRARAATELLPSTGTVISISTGDFSSIGSTNTGLAAGEKDTYALDNRVVLDVWDFDTTARIIDDERWLVTGGAGFRYAYLSQTFAATRTRTGGGGALVNSDEVRSRNMFNGAGPDVMIEAKRFCVGGRFAIYGNARGGALFGDSRFDSSSKNSVPVGGGGSRVTQVDFSASGGTNLIPFLETEAGVEYRGPGDRTFVPFARVGVVGQTWWGAGNGQGFGADTNLGFFGFTFMGGVNY